MPSPHLLDWPATQPRTKTPRRAAFRHNGVALPVDVAIARLEGELGRLGAHSVVLTSDWPRGLNGNLLTGRDTRGDPAVAVHFVAFDKATVLACDRFDRLADNIAALAAHIESLRAIDRYGVGTIEQAFAGYVALPAPEQWWQVLGCKPDTPLATVEQVHRELAKRHHPDRGGSDAMMARLNAALDQARNQLGSARS